MLARRISRITSATAVALGLAGLIAGLAPLPAEAATTTAPGVATATTAGSAAIATAPGSAATATALDSATATTAGSAAIATAPGSEAAAIARGSAATATTPGSAAAATAPGSAAIETTPDSTYVASSSLPTTVGPVLSFKLPYLEHKVDDPNAQEVAQHAAGDAPLLIFLPATGEVPEDYRAFLSTAVSVGYSVLGLDYWNTGRSVTRTCKADPRCYTLLQQNRLNGTDPSRFSRVGTANSILRRFTAAIDYLQILDPQGDWGRYRVDGHPVWKNVVFAGHSQGGGESAYISHLHKLRGVLMFSSPVETFNDVSAAWMSKPGATSPERMYGFDDIHDIYFTRIIGSWRKLRMGDPDPTTATAVPTGSHVMLSDLDIGDPLETHGRSVDDDGPRTPGGGMRFQPTWTWMLQQVLD